MKNYSYENTQIDEMVFELALARSSRWVSVCISSILFSYIFSNFSSIFLHFYPHFGPPGGHQFFSIFILTLVLRVDVRQHNWFTRRVFLIYFVSTC